MQRFERAHKLEISARRANPLRVNPAVHLCSGDTVGAFVEYAEMFEDRPVFAARMAKAASPSAIDWVADRISDLAIYCETTCTTERPLILPVPGICLTETGMIESCVHAAAQTRLCHQELSFEITDTALATSAHKMRPLLQAFRQRGFRVSIDSRRSWSAEISGECWLMIDTLRVRADDIGQDQDLDRRIETAATAGVAIVAEHARWRDGDLLSDRGIDYGLFPRADA